MKKTLTFLTFLALGLLLVGGVSQAQNLVTGRGDFFNITRTVQQTADSVTFVADTLTLFDLPGGVSTFQTGDSIAIMFVQNRFKIVNNMIGTDRFDYIRVQTRNNTGMTLARQAYNNVVVTVPGAGNPIRGTDNGTVYGAATGDKIGLRPVYRPVGSIASSSPFNSDPSAIRQFLTFRVINPSVQSDGVQIRNIFFKPNINNLTNLALPPDTTKDTLRAYHLDGTGISAGDVVQANYTDLAIVRLLPGTTQILMWVKDSAQAVDAGEYIGSFGDYSRGRYFLGDDGLPLADTRTAIFRPSATNANWGPGNGNPDEGLIVDGFPPERNPLKLSALYQTLAPFWYQEQFPTVYPSLVGDACANPNPQNGLIPPYRVGEYAVAHDPYQPGLVSSAVDTIRFFDAWGNRTWDRTTQPMLKALAYTYNSAQPDDRTSYLKGYSAADDTLRQFGQIVFRRLAYTHADVGANAGAVEDSVRIVAMADVHYRGLGNIPQTLTWQQQMPNPTLIDTSGGFPRTFSYSERGQEAWLDNELRVQQTWQIDPDREPVDPNNVNSLPNTGVKITVRPNIPRAIDIRPSDPWKGTIDNNFLRLDIVVVDGYGNTVDDNEKFKFEQSPWGQYTTPNGPLPYHSNGVFDSLTNPVSPIGFSGANIDSGRVAVIAGNMGIATRIFRAASGSNGIGPYRIRVKSTWSFPDRNFLASDLHYPNKLDPAPNGNPVVTSGFSHTNIIPDGSPNNNFGIWFGPDALSGCGTPTQMNAGFGRAMGQTTAIDSTDVIWDGSNWTYIAGRQPRVELVLGQDKALVVGSVGSEPTIYGQPKTDINRSFYVRITDIYGNPMDIAPYFNATDPAQNMVHVSLPSNTFYISHYNGDPNSDPLATDKAFFGAVSPNVALGLDDCPNYLDPRFQPQDPVTNAVLDAELVPVPAGTTLPFISGDVPAWIDYNAVRFFIRAPENVKRLSLAGTDTLSVRAHLTIATLPNQASISISSSVAWVSFMPDVADIVEVFKSNGKPAGAVTPMPWAPGNAPDFIADNYPTGTPQNANEVKEFYHGYYFYAKSADVPKTGIDWPTPWEFGQLGGFRASNVDLDHDATCPIPMDTVVVSGHSQQIRLVARLLDQYRNPIGGRLVKLHVESETLPITPPKTALQDNAQRGGFGELNQSFISDDTLKRTTIGDTAQAGWVTAFFTSGRVGWQIVRVALTPDTMAFDLSDIGRNLGEGTIVGPSERGFAPRVIIPIYQKSDTTVRVEIYPYTAGPSSPVPLPADLTPIQSFETPLFYTVDPTELATSPTFQAWSANPFFREARMTHYGRVANSNIRPYIPDTLNMTATSVTDPNTITAGRKITLLAREYDQFGNLVDNATDDEDTARVRFRMWGAGFGAPPLPYNTAGAGTIVPALDWTNDAYGPVRKIRFRHTQVSNLVSGVHINQTTFLTALEFPTSKGIVNATNVLAPGTQIEYYFEVTAGAVLPGHGINEIDRDTCKVIAVVKNPTRFDVLRAGQDMPRAAAQQTILILTGPPETRVASNNYYPPPQGDSLRTFPRGADANLHWLDANGVDNILVSQVYQRNNSTGVVGLYEVVNNDNVPIDQDGDPLFTDPTASFNPAFNLDESSGMPKILHLTAHNMLVQASSYNILNGIIPQGFTLPPGARDDNVIFDVSIAGGGDGIGTNGTGYLLSRFPDAQFTNVTPLNPLFDFSPGAGSLRPRGVGDDRSPILFRVTPIWENNPPTGGNTYGLNMFTGNNTQPSQTREYPDTISNSAYRLYADTCYAYEGTYTPGSGNRSTDVRLELMGSRTDFGSAAGYAPGSSAPDRITRVGFSTWDRNDFNANGFPRTTADVPGQFRSRQGVRIDGGVNIYGDYNRRAALLGKNVFNQARTGAFSYETTSPGFIAPGAYIRIVDSTAGQVCDLRVIAPDLTDMAGKTVDDTCSYDQGKMPVVRRNMRTLLKYYMTDDTYQQNNIVTPFTIYMGLQGPNFSSSIVKPEQPLVISSSSGRNRLRNVGGITNDVGFFSSSEQAKLKHTFVVIPYRIAYMSIFPSSFDVSQGTNNLDQLPLGILPVQADIDTLPRPIRMIPSPTDDLTKFELFTRLYGQIVHGATDRIPPNVQNPYARPDTIFRDLIYTYAITPYDRYGNLNNRDSMFVNVGARFSDWDFLDLSGTSSFLLVRSGGVYLRTIPRNTPTNDHYRTDTLRLFNPLPTSAVNKYLGIKPDDKRLGVTVGEPGGAPILHGLLPANIISSRPVSVKMPFAPAPFTLDIPALKNRDLFRLDHVGCDPMYVDDTLRLFWETSKWNTANDNPNDTIKYEWYAIIDSVGGTGSVNTRIVSLPADNDGKSNMITIDGKTLRDLIFRPGLQPQPNLDSLVMDIKWFVRAYSKTGLETYSDTAGTSVRQTPLPTPSLIVSVNRVPVGQMSAQSPADGSIVSGIGPGITPVSFTWNPATDVNIDKGLLIGGFKTFNTFNLQWETQGPPYRTVDTLLYQWVGTVVSTYPPGKGAPLGTTIVKTANNLTGIQLTASDFDALFAGFDTDTTSTSADSVTLEWSVIVKDWAFGDEGQIPFPYNDGIYAHDSLAVRADTGRYSWTSCQPHWRRSGPRPFVAHLTKLGLGGIEIEPSQATSGPINKIVGEQVCFTLVAKDNQGQIIRDWDIVGKPTTLTLNGSTANTDTSLLSWNADPDGYTFALISQNGQPLTQTSDNEWSIPPSAFVNGVATICLTHTKADTGVTIEVMPQFAGLNQISATMNFTADAISNFLVEITSATSNPDQVYKFRKYEVVVSPRDKFLNISNKTIKTFFTARFPGEFVNSLPGYSDIFSGAVFITGPTNYFLASTDRHDKAHNEQLQSITAYAEGNLYTSRSNLYEILDHAPAAFDLQQPPDQTYLTLGSSSTPYSFEWDAAPDPYTNITISRFVPGLIGNDDVTYTIIFVDSTSLTKKVTIDSDNLGVENKFSTTGGQLAGITKTIAGGDVLVQPLVWLVEATDGLYITKSTPPNADPQNRPGFRLTIDNSLIVSVPVTGAPLSYALEQNFPNPFNPTTSISYSVAKSGNVNVVVYDLLGNVVKTLVNESQEAGSYKVVWNATNDMGQVVPTGNYILKMVSGDFTQTRKMTLLK